MDIKKFTNQGEYDHGCLACPEMFEHAPGPSRHVRDKFLKPIAELCLSCIGLGRLKVLDRMEKRAKEDRRSAIQIIKIEGADLDVAIDYAKRVQLREMLDDLFSTDSGWAYWLRNKGKSGAIQPKLIKRIAERRVRRSRAKKAQKGRGRVTSTSGLRVAGLTLAELTGVGLTGAASRATSKRLVYTIGGVTCQGKRSKRHVHMRG